MADMRARRRWTRGLLLTTEDDAQIERFELIASTMETIKVKKIREPKLSDILAVRHGRYILRDAEDRKTFQVSSK